MGCEWKLSILGRYESVLDRIQSTLAVVGCKKKTFACPTNQEFVVVIMTFEEAKLCTQALSLAKA